MNSRHKAWRTRREKYGPNGHKCAYARWRPIGVQIERLRTMEQALIRLWREGVLSEGQVAKMTGLDRIRCRELRYEQENASHDFGDK